MGITMGIGRQILGRMDITWTGFKSWILVQMQDAILVGVLWLIGLFIIGVPLAPVWAALGALFQLVPIVGTIFSLVGPAFTAVSSGNWMQTVYVLVLYVIIVLIDGLILQPVLMRRAAKVPVWATILAPVILGTVFNVWGILLAPPLLAIIYTYRSRRSSHSPDTNTVDSKSI